MNMKIENVRLGDLIRHRSDAGPFKVVGIRIDQLELEGDWSGGMVDKYMGTSWAPLGECEPYHDRPSPPPPPKDRILHSAGFAIDPNEKASKLRRWFRGY